MSLMQLGVQTEQIRFDKIGDRVAEISILICLSDYHLPKQHNAVLATLESIYAQTLTVLDVMVVDDASEGDISDQVWHWLDQHQARFNSIRLIQQLKRQGMAPCRNAGLGQIATPFVFILDAGHQLYPRCVSRCLETLKFSNAALAYPLIEQFNTEGMGDISGNRVWDREQLAQGNYIQPIALVRRDAILAVGGYSSLAVPEWVDYDLWCRFAEQDYFGILVPEILARLGASPAWTLPDLLSQSTVIESARVEMLQRHPWLAPNSILSLEDVLVNHLGLTRTDLPDNFDPDYYLALNPDLVLDGVTDRYQALQHFLLHGRSAKRSYDPNQAQSFYAQGDLFAQIGCWDKAIAAYQHALKLAAEIESSEHHNLVSDPVARQVSTQAVMNVARQRLQPIVLKQCGRSEILESAVVPFQLRAESWLELLADYRRAPVLYPELNETIDRLIVAQLDLLSTLGNLRKAEKLVLPHSSSPLVSVVIPVYNKIDYTYRCLQSLAKHLDPQTAIEIIVVNDCSTDETRSVLGQVEGLILINNSENSGFIRSCNHGAAHAKGKYIYFLNNDTEIRPGCLESLIAVLEADESVGAVGSKLIYPSGALQEAGGIIWNDAAGWNYGRMQNPFDPHYNYMRPVDYCSAASLLVRRWVFEVLDGFDKSFIPAYYEDTDLCFSIRNILSLKVVYQPKSELIHYEGISSGTSTASGVKRYQVVNAEKFKQKWQEVLSRDHLPNQGAPIVPKAARRYLGDRTVLIINPYPPCYDKESGARRLFEMIKMLRQLNYHVIFAPNNGYKEQPYVDELQDLQVEVLYTQEGYGTPVVEQIRERLDLIDIAWVCFPEMAEPYFSLLRQNSKIKLVYDTIDLHYLRMKRAWEMLPLPRDVRKAKEWAEMRSRELSLAKQADLTITITPIEQKILQDQGIVDVAVVPNIHYLYGGDRPGFTEREGILFIGGYNHHPNVDAVVWLCEQIMPIVWQQIPTVQVTLLGSNPPAAVKRLAEADARVTVTGYIADVTPYFLSHRVFVAPLRYGAGMKGKVGQSLEYGLPLVSTSIGVEGMGLVDGEMVLVADETTAFAAQILQLYSDELLWQHLAANATLGIEPYTAEAVSANLAGLLDRLLQRVL